MMCVSDMIGVFIVMLNVLIAVVCDNYSIAVSKAHEIFLRSRLQIVTFLDMQGVLKLRHHHHHQVPSSSSHFASSKLISSQRSFSKKGSSFSGGGEVARSPIGRTLVNMFSFNDSVRQQEHRQLLQQQQQQVHHQHHHGHENRAEYGFMSSMLDKIHFLLKDGLWHYYMKKFLKIGGKNYASNDDKAAKQSHILDEDNMLFHSYDNGHHQSSSSRNSSEWSPSSLHPNTSNEEFEKRMMQLQEMMLEKNEELFKNMEARMMKKMFSPQSYGT
jgi:hypothetical protein